jgi:hypothetical protein
MIIYLSYGLLLSDALLQFVLKNVLIKNHAGDFGPITVCPCRSDTPDLLKLRINMPSTNWNPLSVRRRTHPCLCKVHTGGWLAHTCKSFSMRLLRAKGFGRGEWGKAGNILARELNSQPASQPAYDLLATSKNSSCPI